MSRALLGKRWSDAGVGDDASSPLLEDVADVLDGGALLASATARSFSDPMAWRGGAATRSPRSSPGGKRRALLTIAYFA